MKEGDRVNTLYGPGTVRVVKPPRCKILLDKATQVEKKRTKVVVAKICVERHFLCLDMVKLAGV